MMPRILSLATLGTALGCGLIAGAFFAFSTFVMKALGSLPPSQAVRAMQAINVAAPTGLFLATLLGTALACSALAIQAVLGWSQPRATLRLAGARPPDRVSPGGFLAPLSKDRRALARPRTVGDHRGGLPRVDPRAPPAASAVRAGFIGEARATSRPGTAPGCAG